MRILNKISLRRLKKLSKSDCFLRITVYIQVTVLNFNLYCILEATMIRGTIFDIKKFAIHDGPGIRTTVFLKGCPLSCWWCHNPESHNIEPEYLIENDSKKKKLFGTLVTVDKVIDEVKKDLPFYEQSKGGVTYSGGEPMIQPEFLLALLKKSKEEKLHTAVDTAGNAPFEDFKKINDFVDIYLYDLKLIDDDDHIKYTGISNQQILDNLKSLLEIADNVHLRIPLIPDITDTKKNLEGILAFIQDLNNVKNISILPYNLLSENKIHKFNLPGKLINLKPQTDDELKKIRELFSSNGYIVSIGG